MSQPYKNNKLPILLIIIAFVSSLWIFPNKGYSDEKMAAVSTPGESSPEIDPVQLENRLEKNREILKVVESEENEKTAKQLGTTLAELQKRNTMIRNLVGIYQRLLTSLRRRDSLKKEEKNLITALESTKERLIKDPPPYSLSLYDSFLDKVTAVDHKEQTENATISYLKKSFEDAKTRHALSGQKLRKIKEQIEFNKDGENLLLLNWNYESAKIAEELAQGTIHLPMIDLENAEIEINLAQLKKSVIQRDVVWVSSQLAFDQEDLNKHLSKTEEKRNELQERIATLMQEQHGVENKWLEAQKEVEKVKESDEEVKAIATAFLKAREAWRETYQKVLSQAELMIYLLNSEDQVWQRRYALLSPDIKYSELDTWKNESKSFIKRLEVGMGAMQTYQNNIQSQIIAVEKQLPEEEIDSVVKQHIETRLNALRKSAERNLEFQSSLLGVRELQRRLISEIDSRQKTGSLKEQFEGFGDKILKLWEFELWVINDRSVTVKKVVIALFIFVVGMVLARVFTRSLGKRLSSATRLDQSSASAIEKVLYYFVLLFLILFALRTVNIPLTIFTFFGGAIAIGVGFGAQNLINNFISGFILMIERPVKIGDLIEVDNNYGIVEEIGTRCTRIRTAGNMHILVPNSSFLEKNIINWTLADLDVRSQITVGVEYGTDTRKVRTMMLKAVGEHGKVLKKPEPFVLFSDFGDNALVFDVYFWIRIQRIMDRRMIESDMRFLIDEHFREAGIVIAFPQRDVHLDTLKPLDVRVLSPEDKSAKE